MHNNTKNLNKLICKCERENRKKGFESVEVDFFYVARVSARSSVVVRVNEAPK